MSNAQRFNPGDTIELDHKYYTVTSSSIDELGPRYILNEHGKRKDIPFSMQYVDKSAQYIPPAEPYIYIDDTSRIAIEPHSFQPDDIIEFPSGSKRYFKVNGIIGKKYHLTLTHDPSNPINKRLPNNANNNYTADIEEIDRNSSKKPMPETDRNKNMYKRSRTHSRQRGGKRMTRRNKLRKKRRKTNRRKSNRRR